MRIMARSSRPRIRTLKPEFWEDERLDGLGDLEHRLYVGLITQADDEGRGSAHLQLIRARLFPFDARSREEFANALDALHAHGLICLYEADGRPLAQIVSWAEDQRVDKPTPSFLPPPPLETPANTEDPGFLASPRDESRGDANDRSSRARALDQDRDRTTGVCADANAAVTDAVTAVDDERLTETIAILRTAPRLHFDVELMGVANVLAMYPPPAEHVKAAHLAVSRAADPAYRTTSAARALEFAFSDLSKRERQLGEIRAAGGKPAPAAKPWSGALHKALEEQQARKAS